MKKILPPTYFLSAIVLPALFDIAFIKQEEAMLEQRFGDQFKQYRDRVRKWI